jgi:soluble lytic murein transglycosylase-like protein
MSRNPVYLAIVADVAGAHKLDQPLVCAVIEQESNWNPWAVRYETDFFTRYVRSPYLAGKFAITEAQTRTMSYGLMQVMGEVARELGFDGEFLTELCDPRVGVEFGCRLLARRLAASRGVVVEALLGYNGGADHAYPGRVLARVPTYQTPGETSA